MAIQATLEVGKSSSLRSQNTPEGYTHDWEVFVRGVNNADIQQYIEKVVFHLHATFPKPKRVFKEPPYIVKESGYAGFVIPIHIYLKNKDEPKKFQIMYDLQLQQLGPPVSTFVRHSEVFVNPSEEFRKKLLKGGAITVSTSEGSSDKNEAKSTPPMISKPKLSGTESKKHRLTEPKGSNTFAALFGPPIKTAKVSPDNKKLSSDKIANAKIPSASEKGEKLDKSTKAKHSPHKDAKKDKLEEKKEKKEKDWSKEKEKNKEKSNKRSLSPSSKNNHMSPKRKRTASPIVVKKPPSPSPVKIAPSPKPKDKDPSKKTDKEPKDKIKDAVKATTEDQRSDKKKEKKKHKEDKEKEKKDKHKDKEREKSREVVKSGDKKLEKPEKPSKEKSQEPKLPKEERKAVKEPVKEPEKPKEEKLAKPEKLDKPKESKSDRDKSKHKHKKKDKKEKRDGSKEREKKEKREKLKEKQQNNANAPAPLLPASATNPLSALLAEMPERDSSDSANSMDEETFAKKESVEYTTPPTAEMARIMSPLPPPPLTDARKEKGERHKRDRSKLDRENRKKKRRLEEEKNESAKREKLEREHSPSPLVEPVSSSQSPIGVEMNNSALQGQVKDERESGEHKKNNGSEVEQVAPDSTNSTLVEPENLEPPVFSEDYVSQLKDLQQKIMTLQDNQELQRVVQVIAETGQYEITKKTFDFDLCALDRRTVQRLQQFFAS